MNKSTSTSTRPIDVIVTVVRFSDVIGSRATGPRLTDYKMALRPGENRAQIVGDDIRIRPPGAPIRFIVASADNRQYRPLGIAFAREGAKVLSESDRLGLVVFAERELQPEQRAVVVSDSYAEAPRNVRFKFTLFIQRGSDGAIGLIDPGIIHSNE